MYNRDSFLIKTYRLFNSLSTTFLKNEYKDFYRYNKNCTKGQEICIVLDKGMGDFILYSYYLKHTICYFESIGKKVFIIADNYNYEFFKAFFDVQEHNIIIIDRKSLKLIDGRNLSIYRGCFELAILPVYHLTPRVMQIIRVLSPGSIYSLNDKLFPRKYSFFDYFVFNKISSCDIKENFYCNMHKSFYEKLTEKTINYDILEPKNVDKIESEDYFIINVEANNKKTLLDIDKLIELGLSLYKRTNLKPILIGKIDNFAVDIFDKNVFEIKYTNIKDMKTTISLCKYAKFIITCDTGIYHLALSIKDGPLVFVPTWSDRNALFEPYSSELNCSERVKYIRLFESCDNCKEKGLKCNMKCICNKQLYCVKNLKTCIIENSICKYI